MWLSQSLLRDENITVMKTLSPQLDTLFNPPGVGDFWLISFFVSPTYETDSSYLTYGNYYDQFLHGVLTVSEFASVQLDFPYTHVEALIEEVFTRGYDPPIFVNYNFTTYPEYMKLQHYEPLRRAESLIQSYSLGNGISAISVILLSLVVDFGSRKVLKIITFITAAAIMGWSVFSIFFF